MRACRPWVNILLPIVLVGLLSGCALFRTPEPTPTLTPTPTPRVTPTPTPTPTSTPTPEPETPTVDPLDFSYLPKDQRPVLVCVPVSSQEGAEIAREWDLESTPTGWRIEMGAGNKSSETWSLFFTGYNFWLTNFWSTAKPSGPTAIAVTDTTESFNSWDDLVDWSPERRAAGELAAQWMAYNCA